MKIDAHKLKDNPSMGNHMVAALAYPDCPMSEKRPCFHMVVGFGTVQEICPHFKEIPGDENEADCTFGE
jgi:hypothetical protein